MTTLFRDPGSESCDTPCDYRNRVEKQGKLVINAYTGFSPSPQHNDFCVLLRNLDASQDPKAGPAQ